jgi:hypothetical protein
VDINAIWFMIDEWLLGLLDILVVFRVSRYMSG